MTLCDNTSEASAGLFDVLYLRASGAFSLVGTATAGRRMVMVVGVSIYQSMDKICVRSGMISIIGLFSVFFSFFFFFVFLWLSFLFCVHPVCCLGIILARWRGCRSAVKGY